MSKPLGVDDLLRKEVLDCDPRQICRMHCRLCGDLLYDSERDDPTPGLQSEDFSAIVQKGIIAHLDLFHREEISRMKDERS